MPTLIIRDVPKTMHERLKQQAIEHHRSAAKEALAVLEERLGMPRLPRWDLLEGLPKIGKKGADPVGIIRKMRDGR